MLDVGTIEAMYNIYKEECLNNTASVSPMYTYGTKYCYPTHRHWHTDPIYKTHSKYGVIRHTSAGVPFLCSMWNPNMFNFLDEIDKKIIHVDGDLGKLVYKKGFKHLRLYNHNIGHYKGGKNSRK